MAYCDCLCSLVMFQGSSKLRPITELASTPMAEKYSWLCSVYLLSVCAHVAHLHLLAGVQCCEHGCVTGSPVCGFELYTRHEQAGSCAGSVVPEGTPCSSAAFPFSIAISSAWLPVSPHHWLFFLFSVCSVTLCMYGCGLINASKWFLTIS